MRSPCTIGRAGTGDLDALAPMLDAYRVFYRQASDEGAARAFLAERLAREESVVFIARRADAGGAGKSAGGSAPAARGTAVGFAQLYPGFSSVGLGTRWVLNDLYVVESARRLGVGRALVERAMAHTRETGAGSVWLLTEKTNDAAQRLYAALGWERDEVYWRYLWKA